MYMRKSFRKSNKKEPRKQTKKLHTRRRRGGFSFFTKKPTTIDEIDEKTRTEFNLTDEELINFTSMKESDKIKFIKDKTCLVREKQTNPFTGNPMPRGFTKVPNKYKCRKLCNVLKQIGDINDCGDEFKTDACYIDGEVDNNENKNRNCKCNPDNCEMSKSLTQVSNQN